MVEMAGMLSRLRKSLSLRISSQHSTDSSSVSSMNRASDVATSEGMPPVPVTSSSIFRLSRSSSSSSKCSKKSCAICLGSMRVGQGRALFTAECSHAFHFSCIASSVKHGNHLCPICRASWKEVPYRAPTFPATIPRTPSQPPPDARPQITLAAQPLNPPDEPRQYDDDDPLYLRPSSSSDLPLDDHHVATIATHPEFPAVPASESRPSFAVLVSFHAPPAHHHQRAPVDLVLVLDVSGSMAGTKLLLLKRAVRFVVVHLSSSDRLAVVAFSSTARRVLHLQRMTHEGCDRANAAVNSLSAAGGTNIAEGLRKGIRVLQERRERNPVSSIILLSDGKDTYSTSSYNRHDHHRRDSSSSVLNFVDLSCSDVLPNSSSTTDGSAGTRDRTSAAEAIIPVHSFGFGVDHDAPAMHAISDSTGGTFSFIEAEAAIQEAFTRCIGGLLSVVAQEVQLSLSSASPSVTIGKIPAGNHSVKLSDEGRTAVISIGDVYADESKDFLVPVCVPISSSSGGPDAMMPLLSVGCAYKDPLSQETVHVDAQTVEILRPNAASHGDESTVSLQVDRQRNRVLVADAIAEAKALADRGDLDAAQLVLANQRSALLASASAQAGDALCGWLEAELKDVRERMASQEMYETSGRAYVLSGLSSHSWQRATTRGGRSMVLAASSVMGEASGAFRYETPSISSMVSRSQALLSLSQVESASPLHRTSSLHLPRG